MSGLRGEVLDWFAAKRVAPGGEHDVLREAGIYPGRADWRSFLSSLTLWLGTLALAAALIFFFAFNWDDLGRFAKFGLVEGAILIGLAACWRLGLDGAPGKAVLVLLSLLVGALLALTGQVYQTGADSYELFAWWAVLILPWTILGRFSPLWLVWLAIVNLAVILYPLDDRDSDALLWILFGINGIALAAWEAAHRAGLSWLRDSWPPRLLALASGIAATSLIGSAIFDGFRGTGALSALAYAGWLAAFYFWYRRIRPDLFMLAGGLFSLIVTIVMFLAQNLIDQGSGSYLLIGLAVIGMSAGGAIWLKSVARGEAAE
ncbi:MAG TPA: DUF2157 domain-containing protein [Allosphingosinicella sp.]